MQAPSPALSRALAVTWERTLDLSLPWTTPGIHLAALGRVHAGGMWPLGSAHLIDHLHPLGQVVEGLLLGDVVHEDDALGASVVG